ncbi:MAG: T9SS type A sorting domain-containing protein [Candidatus Kapabacteria bacterium]|nr:T9SS type A sorting domain-containing protein [Ignavibacteriota bacterium]MCW5883635.1 T9SS type A sorting domain-containing protein [Candidatus Kapabacteria bacterium]
MKKYLTVCILLIILINTNLYSRSGWTFFKYNDLPVPGISFCIQSDYNGGVFLGTTGGLMKHNGYEWTKIYYNELNPMETYNKFNIRRITVMGGNVWASTNEGLIKFTGYDSKHYNVSNTPSMYNDKIRGIAPDKYGNIWFVNHTLGIFKLDKSSDTVVYYSIPQSTPLPFSQDIPMFCDAYDNLWYSCAGKFVKFSEGNIKIIDETEIPELKKDTVSSIQIMSDNSIIVLMKRSIGNYKDYNGTITYNAIDIPSGLMNDNEYFSMVKVDLEGNCWILSRLYEGQGISSKYFYKYSKNKEWTKYEFPTFEGTTQNLYALTDFSIDEKGKVWFSDPYFGVFVFDSKTTSVKNAISMSSINIYPNPTSDYITISFQTTDVLETSVVSKVQIFDMLGVEVMTESIHPMTSSHRMNISHLPRGVYFIQIGNYSEKFVKL